MYRALIWGFEEELTAPAIKKLESEGVITIKSWFGNKTLYSHCTEDGDIFRNAKPYGYSFCGYDVKIYNKIYIHFSEFIDQYSRHFKTNRLTPYEYLHLFNMYFDFFYNEIRKLNINLLLMFDVPHDGVDLIVYLIAKELNIITVIPSPSIVQNRFFYVRSIDDYGVFDSCDKRFTNSIQKLNNEHKKDLFYMQPFKIDKKFSLKKKKYQLKSFFSRNLIDLIINELQKIRNKTEYKKQLRKLAAKDVNLNNNFIYFPLHLQPEATTSGLGGKYADQLLAIEHLRMCIPGDWLIYVKENPKQDYFMRGTAFFERLSRIPNLVFADKSIDTYKLIENCQFVATITGTAGWEAITGGKCAVVFGEAWYKNFPGVYRFSPELDFIQISKTTPYFKSIQSKYNDLVAKMPQGILEIAYKVDVPGYSDEENQHLFYSFLKSVLQASG